MSHAFETVDFFVSPQGGPNQKDDLMEGYWRYLTSPYPEEEKIRLLEIGKPIISELDLDEIPEIGGNVTLGVSVPEELRSRVRLFHVQGKGQVVLKNNRASSRAFETKVPIHRANRHSFVATAQAGGKDIDIPTTWYPQNCVYLAVFNPLGQTEVWCFSLVAQHGKFFAVIEKTNQFHAYWDDTRETVVFPDCEWPEFVAKVLEPAFHGWVMELHGMLPDVDGIESRRAKEDAIDRIDEIASEVIGAKVLWYNICKGLGTVILPDGRVARVHWESIKEARDEHARSDLFYLVTSDAIWFEKIGAPRQTGEHKTAFAHEVFGATIKSLVG